MADSATLLCDIFGFDAFRPGQEEIVEAVAAGRDVLAIMPTGGGKSLCFQLPALMRAGVTVVISPLIALMRDQVRALRAAGVDAGALTSGNTEEETEAVWAAITSGTLKLLYLAPERLASAGAQDMLRRMNVSMIAVDEAHCVSQWGHDFRPDYLRIGELRAALDVPVAAFTATADAETRDEIVQRLFADRQPEQFLHGFDRPNIHLAFAAKDQPRRQILDFAAARKGQSGIVYCGTRAKTEALAKALTEAGHAAIHYHGGMEADLRRTAETRFQQEDGLIVVATVAFGMGVDKPDIRWVAHADLPKSIEAYYQEIGRAGRDGAPAETLTLFGPDDIRLRRSQIDEGLAPPERRMADHGRLNALLGLAEALECRRATLLGDFGETGIILTGNPTEKVKARGHEDLPTFGVGRDLKRGEWQAIFRQMMGHDLIRPNPDRHGALTMTDGARPILRGEDTIRLRRDSITAAKARRPAVKTLINEEDEPLLSALKAKRRELAETQGVPAYIIFNDRTLIEMAETRPDTLDAMAGISGVGAKKLDTYGATFLSVITGTSEEMHPKRMKLAGRDSGALYDQLMAAQGDLHRGADGTEKPLSCSTTQISKVVEYKPRDAAALERILGDRRAERFGAAFLDVIAATG